MEGLLVKVLVSLAAVLGVMAALTLLIRKFFFSADPGNSVDAVIQVRGHRMLAPKRSVYVLHVLGRWLVVGVTEQGMCLLSEFEDTSTDQRELPVSELLPEQVVSPASKFLAYLRSHLSTTRWNRTGPLRKVEREDDR